MHSTVGAWISDAAILKLLSRVVTPKLPTRLTDIWIEGIELLLFEQSWKRLRLSSSRNLHLIHIAMARGYPL